MASYRAGHKDRRHTKEQNEMNTLGYLATYGAETPRIVIDLTEEMHAGGFVVATVNEDEYHAAAELLGLDLLITGDGSEADQWMRGQLGDDDARMELYGALWSAASVTCLDGNDVAKRALAAGCPADETADEWLYEWLPTVGVDANECGWVARIVINLAD